MQTPVERPFSAQTKPIRYGPLAACAVDGMACVVPFHASEPVPTCSSLRRKGRGDSCSVVLNQTPYLSYWVRACDGLCVSFVAIAPRDGAVLSAARRAFPGIAPAPAACTALLIAPRATMCTLFFPTDPLLRRHEDGLHEGGAVAHDRIADSGRSRWSAGRGGGDRTAGREAATRSGRRYSARGRCARAGA